LEEYSFVESLNQNLNGHIFGLFYQNSTQQQPLEKSNNSNKTKIVQNLKILKNLGSQIKQVLLAPSNRSMDTGVLIRYDLGDTCQNNSSNNIII